MGQEISPLFHGLAGGFDAGLDFFDAEQVIIVAGYHIVWAQEDAQFGGVYHIRLDCIVDSVKNHEQVTVEVIYFGNVDQGAYEIFDCQVVKPADFLQKEPVLFVRVYKIEPQEPGTRIEGRNNVICGKVGDQFTVRGLVI